ncbi:uncharacterized protein F5147DRAFT_684272 [Suillus discolor]|uniref:Uncharacterized protein n=1 Tax=Suillus discolor TaxID=1912936 RepID=A0A9P7JWN7_9AGAM|nr:uncharacterized protein F5147DRAFT_684272 [Suillus discolor]KAG2112207.1 hypothetical protein F5147DRAFT_684272 [Suillus discolor]
MSTNSPPSVILTDALASLNKAVNIAFTNIQDQTRQEVTQASTEAREARRERDEAIKALHELRLEEQAWKQEAGVRQSAVEQAELTIKHHAETIAQLRYESEQWKQQCLRLEDTSRQEATSWKEQFLRVEQERYKLATRVDELIEEQLSHTVQTHASITPFKTMLRYPNTTASTSISDPSASTRHRFPPYTSELPDESISASSSRAPKPISTQQLPTPISANRRASGDKSKQYLIRRVQAVIEVPVKEESVEDTISDEAPSASSSSASSRSGLTSTVPGSSKLNSAISSKTIPKPSKPTSAPSKAGQGTNKVFSITSKSASLNNKPTSAASTKSAPPPSKSAARPSKPTLSGAGNKPPSNPSTSIPSSSSRPARKISTKRQYIEIDEDEDRENKISEQSKSGSDATAEDEVDSSEEEEDELTLGAEENRREVYGTKRIAATSSMKAVSQAPAKKRKLISNTTAVITGSGKKPPAKNARG